MKKDHNLTVHIYGSMDLSPDLRKGLSQLVHEGRNGTIFHTPEWNDIVRRIFQTEFLLMVAERAGTILGMMPLHLFRIDSLRMNAFSPPRFLEVPYGGPVFKEGLSYGECSDILRRFLDRASLLENGISIHLHTAPDPSLIGKACGEKSNIMQTGFVLLEPSLHDIWMGISSKRRNMIRKAEKYQ